MSPRVGRTWQELEKGAAHVCQEWITAAHLTSIADGYMGPRSIEQSAVIAALLVHYRCLVNFLCGDYKGQWRQSDICPADFMGATWFLGDEELDRRMRGRLPTLNSEQSHVSWARLDEAIVVWPVGLLVREVSVGLSRFTDEVQQLHRPGAGRFISARDEVGEVVKPREFDRATGVALAPARS